ncbi:type II toxin-antitoxin system PemK/MazF family toxin [Mycolicibacter kumamotonensis]|uniref:type II toxin-antitoxin system PemK/MazF family toxin n=1 Tax=Mycolicibacter kumamotonensis TaxID=354243 RepID=UPI002E8075AC|nr:type II toxin-antitoxin system PemK/MazF family toxin [Mycolicibacter kumamotonensis]
MAGAVSRGRGSAQGRGCQRRARSLVIRGAVYRIDLGRPRGHQQGGKRLGLVVSPSDSPLSVVTVVPTSTSAGPSIHRPEIEIAGRPTRLLVDQIRSIDTHYVVGDPVDYLTRDQLVEVELALVHYLGVQEAIPPRSS